MHRVATTLGNLLWLASCLPGWVCFKLALYFPRQTQLRILRRITTQNRETRFLREQPFDQLAPRSYDDMVPEIERIMRGEPNVLTRVAPFLLEPTGGSTSGTKLIPYTRALKQEFQRAIDPWIAGLFLKWPSLLFGRHYWCITPSTPIDQDSAVPIGFDSDDAYLGRLQRWLVGRIFAVPSTINTCGDRASAEYHTLVHLLNAPDLRLVSVWHPSLLTLMLQTLESRFDELLDTLETGSLPSDIRPAVLPPVSPQRARQLRAAGCIPSRIWNKLAVISCWSGTTTRSWIDELERTFPGAVIQPKGLVATEGITSIPLGTVENVAAVRSHFYEFESLETGAIHPLWALEPGKRYHLLLTTGGGLYRYKTDDQISVAGCAGRTPCLRFMARSNLASDLFGEKISQEQAERIVSDLPCRPRFAMLAPEQTGQGFRYALYIDAEDGEKLHEHFEMELSKSYHYRHARNLRQLAPAVAYRVENGEAKVFTHLASLGRQAGSIKLTALRNETFWTPILLGPNHEK